MAKPISSPAISLRWRDRRGLELRDDAALMRPPPGEDLVLTTDALVAGVHFFADDPPGAIARKALRVNLSDLAAKAARPLGFLLALALPSDWRDEWLGGLCRGSRRRRLGLRMPAHRRRHGGDAGAVDAERDRDRRRLRKGGCPGARASGPATASMSPARSATPRSASRFGWGGGPTFHRRDKAFLLERYLRPSRASALIDAMAAHASGGMDVSDGFVGDLAKMLDVSGVSARVPIYRLPLSPAARAAIAADPGLFEVAATGGDDYELLASAPRRIRGRLRGGGCGGGRAIDVCRRSGRGPAAAELHRPRRQSGRLRARRLQPLLTEIR